MNIFELKKTMTKIETDFEEQFQQQSNKLDETQI